MPIKVTVSLSGAKPPTQSVIFDAMAEAMREAEQMVANEARAEIHVRTGHTRQSIRALPIERLSNGVRGGIAANDVGRYLEHGTATFSDDPDVQHKPYIIKPKYKKALAWAHVEGPSLPQHGGRPLTYVEAGVRTWGNKHTPPITGQMVRLTGKLRSPIQRALQAGIFSFSDAMMVRSFVIHPGIRARPFMRPALEAVLPKMGDLLAAALRKRLGQ